ncbi:hypothetical protein GZL_05194 [Streptomyces sp. 769]|nr:hypothetical protein GZL_05194 [Streptomyces sp. 769]
MTTDAPHPEREAGPPHTPAVTPTADELAAYAALPTTGPYGVRPGHALITMVEPHPGHEHADNRWYEGDHFIAGAMAMPRIFAGPRCPATGCPTSSRSRASTPG